MNQIPPRAMRIGREGFKDRPSACDCATKRELVDHARGGDAPDAARRVREPQLTVRPRHDVGRACTCQQPSRVASDRALWRDPQNRPVPRATVSVGGGAPQIPVGAERQATHERARPDLEMAHRELAQGGDLAEHGRGLGTAVSEEPLDATRTRSEIAREASHEGRGEVEVRDPPRRADLVNAFHEIRGTHACPAATRRVRGAAVPDLAVRAPREHERVAVHDRRRRGRGRDSARRKRRRRWQSHRENRHESHESGAAHSPSTAARSRAERARKATYVAERRQHLPLKHIGIRGVAREARRRPPDAGATVARSDNRRPSALVPRGHTPARTFIPPPTTL